jgi:hypothetical protein
MDLSMSPKTPPGRRDHTASLLRGPRLRLLTLEEMCFTDAVDVGFLERAGFRLPNQPPVVCPVGRVFLILDGNHRCAYDFVIRRMREVECAVWTREPPVEVLTCESGLFRAVLADGIDAAIEAHRLVTGAIGAFAPGEIVYR